MKGYMMLEDGTVLEGKAFGDEKTVFGELQCHTDMAGYEELLTDPANAGRIMLMTYPLLGNIGLSEGDNQYDGPYPAAVIVKDYTEAPSHYQCAVNLSDYLRSKGIFGLSYVDTRMIGRKLRNGGIKCCLTTQEPDETIWEKLRVFSPKSCAAPGGVRKKTVYHHGQSIKLAVIDLGSRKELLSDLKDQDCHILLYPYDTAPEAIFNENPYAVLISHGGGDLAALSGTVSTLEKIIGKAPFPIPVYGIGLGSIVLAQSQGMTVYKMSSGHRGGNYAVQCVKTGKVCLTKQNIDYAVEKTASVTVTHINVNDGIVEGYRGAGFAGRSYLPERQELIEWIGGIYASQ